MSQDTTSAVVDASASAGHGSATGAEKGDAFENLLHETRKFAPSPEFAADAVVTAAEYGEANAEASFALSEAEACSPAAAESDAALLARGPQARTTAPAQRSQMDSRDEITIRRARPVRREAGRGVSRRVTS